VSNSRSLPTHTRREHFPLNASLFYELSFSNFPLLYSSRSGVTCHPPPDAKQRVFRSDEAGGWDNTLAGASTGLPDASKAASERRPVRDSIYENHAHRAHA